MASTCNDNERKAAINGGSPTVLKTKVVVVGAGIAGVTAAAKLVRNGIKDVVVLEAQEHIGGRIKAQYVERDVALDMGAMFVHGQAGNPIYEIVQRLGMEANDLENVPNFTYTSNRQKIPNEEIDDLLEEFEENKRAMPAKVGQNKGEMMEKLYDRFRQENHVGADHPKRELYDAALRFFLFYECTEEGCRDLHEASAWCDTNYAQCDGNQHVLIKGGYSTVMRSLLALIPKDIIRTRSPVRNIDWHQLEDGGVLVRCENGDIYKADHVIVTISMGCLKTVHDSMFSPSLPATLVNTFHRVEMGSIGKVFVKWDTPFWNTKEGVMYNFLWLESEQPASMKQDKSGQKTCFGKPWWTGLNGCHSMPDNNHYLLFWFLRHQMDAIKDLDDQEILGVLHELMHMFILDIDIPKPSAMYRTDWELNPYTKGTFTFGLPSFDSSDVENLNRPVFPSAQNPRLLFAGESFTIEHITTTHGAFTTGEEQAERILKANGIKEFKRVVDSISYQ